MAILFSAVAGALAAQGWTTHAQAQGGDLGVQISDHGASELRFPIDGLWHEDTPTACQKTSGDTAAEPVRELKFDAASSRSPGCRSKPMSIIGAPTPTTAPAARCR